MAVSKQLHSEEDSSGASDARFTWRLSTSDGRESDAPRGLFGNFAGRTTRDFPYRKREARIAEVALK